jgi:hypothetical protein
MDVKPFDRIADEDVVLVDGYGNIYHVVPVKTAPELGAPIVVEKRQRIYWPVVVFILAYVGSAGALAYVMLR